MLHRFCLYSCYILVCSSTPIYEVVYRSFRSTGDESQLKLPVHVTWEVTVTVRVNLKLEGPLGAPTDLRLVGRPVENIRGDLYRFHTYCQILIHMSRMPDESLEFQNDVVRHVTL